MNKTNLENFSQYFIKHTTTTSTIISIIIPVYNRSNKIVYCLNKLLESNYDKKNFEVIVVDDCSTDNTFEVLKSFIDLFPNISILKRKLNSGGASLPRNDGIDFSSGKYLLFIDSDDYITANALLDSTNLIINDITIDMVCMPYFKSEGSSRKISSSAFHYTDATTGLIFKNTKLFNSLNAVGKLLRSSIIKGNNITFPEGIKVREDNWFMMKAYSVMKNIAILGNTVNYYYTADVDEVSLSKNGTPPKDAVNIYISTYDFLMKDNSITLDDKIDLLSIFMNRYTNLIKRGKHAPIKLLNHTRNELKLMSKNSYLDTNSRDFITDLLNGKYNLD